MADQYLVPLAAAKGARIAHDLGLAGLLGGNLFGRVALHPAVAAISDPAERGKVVNATWKRYGTINALALGAVTAGWIGARADEAANHRLSRAERRLAAARDVLLGAVAVSGVVTAYQGVKFARSAPQGAVPLEDGDNPTDAANAHQKRVKRRLNVLGLTTLASETALISVNAALAQENFRRPPLRRVMRQRMS